MPTMKINEDVTVGPQPSVEELKSLALQGFKTVINFRTKGEQEQPLSPDEEGEIVKAAGLQYVHIPVSTQEVGPDTVDRFRHLYPELQKPVFAHCKSGKRAGAMVMMNQAVEKGLSGEQTLDQATKMGFECDQPQLKQLVLDYVDHHAKGA